MRWFKHFTDNHRGRSVQHLLDNVGHFGPFFYYTMFEMCAEKLEKKNGQALVSTDCVFVFHKVLLRRLLRANWATISSSLAHGATMGLWRYEMTEKELRIEVPILLELMGRDLRGPRSDRAPTALRPRLEEEEEKEKDKCTEQFKIDPCSPLFLALDFFFKIKQIKKELIEAWKNQYPEEWLIQEINKAKIWCIANERKKPKNSSTFLTNWFLKGWEAYRKTLPSSAKAPTPFFVKELS